MLTSNFAMRSGPSISKIVSGRINLRAAKELGLLKILAPMSLRILPLTFSIANLGDLGVVEARGACGAGAMIPLSGGPWLSGTLASTLDLSSPCFSIVLCIFFNLSRISDFPAYAFATPDSQ